MNNQKGFSLLEVLVSSAIGVLVVVMASLFLLEMTRANHLVFNHAAKLAESQSMKQTMQKYFSLAINIDWTQSTINNIGSGRGKLLEFQSGLNLSGTPQTPVTVAAFLREMGYPSASQTGSDIRATAIYFTEPTPTQGGRLSLATSGPGYGSVQLNSNQVDIHFDEVVEFEISSVGQPISSGEPVRIARLKIVTRNFNDPDPTTWRYCPQSFASSTSCDGGAAFVDQVQYINIALINSKIDSDFGAAESIYGNLYAFGIWDLEQ